MPPARKIADALRTGVAAALALPRIVGPLVVDRIRPAASTTDPAGLAHVRARFGFALRCLGVELETFAAERVPRDGGLVFMWNQETHLDHLVLAVAIPRPFFSLYNNEVARFPLYGENLRRSGHVHVDRNDEAQWRAAVTGAAARVRAGECVLVSPEGTRSADGKLLPLKRGALILATEAQRPVVCVTVIGGHERLPRGAMAVRPGPIYVEFSEPIAVRGGGDEEAARDALAEEVARTFSETKRRRPPKA